MNTSEFQKLEQDLLGTAPIQGGQKYWNKQIKRYVEKYQTVLMLFNIGLYNLEQDHDENLRCLQDTLIEILSIKTEGGGNKEEQEQNFYTYKKTLEDYILASMNLLREDLKRSEPQFPVRIFSFLRTNPDPALFPTDLFPTELLNCEEFVEFKKNVLDESKAWTDFPVWYSKLSYLIVKFQKK